MNPSWWVASTLLGSDWTQPFKWIVRGNAGSDRRLAKKLARTLLDYMAAGYELSYGPTGDILVTVEDGRMRLIYERDRTLAPRAG
jgi:hypothetical protein